MGYGWLALYCRGVYGLGFVLRISGGKLRLALKNEEIKKATKVGIEGLSWIA